MLKTVFFGSPPFVAPILENLYQNTELKAIVTKPGESYIKKYAKKHNIKLYQPKKFDKKVKRWIRRVRCDFYVTAAFGLIIPKSVLEIPEKFPLNIHYSALPKYRGAAPVQTALLQGDTSIGTTIQVMAPEMDAGDIAWQEYIDIHLTDNTATLLKKLTALTNENLMSVLNGLASGKIIPQAQNEAEVSKALPPSFFNKENAEINWDQPTMTVHNKIRAFYPEPTAYTTLTDTAREQTINVNIVATLPEHPENHPENLLPGDIYTTKTDIYFRTANGFIKILQLQPEAKRVMAAKDFINGYRRYLS